MHHTSEDNRPEPDAVTEVDPLTRIDDDLDGLAELDPAEAVDVLADITVELNRELDADAERS